MRNKTVFLKYDIDVSFDANDLVDPITSELDENDLFDFIVKLEDAYASYELAERLRDHFDNVIRKFGGKRQQD